MDCDQFREYVSGAVDNCLKKEELESLLEHAGRCPVCRYEYEMEKITKSVVHSRVKTVSAPVALTYLITEQLRVDILPARAPRIRRLFERPYFRPALVFGAAFVGMIIILSFSDQATSPPSIPSLASNDVISQSVTNYRAVVEGIIKPQLVSNDPEMVKGIFASIKDFQVLVPKMKECKLVGGVMNEFSGVQLAHVLYTHEADVVYMYQTCWETVMAGDKLDLPRPAKQELQRTGWYSEELPDGHSIVLWKKGRTLCSAVARMSKTNLLACLSDAELPTDTGW